MLHDAGDYLFQSFLVDRKGSRTRGTHLHMEMQEHAAAVVTDGDPTEAAQCHRRRLSSCILLPCQRQQQLGQQLAYVVVRPRTGDRRHRGEAMCGRVLCATDPDFDLDCTHDRSSGRVTGISQAKLRQPYAAGWSATRDMAATQGMWIAIRC